MQRIAMSLNVLIVEDDDLISDLLVEILTSAGYQTTTMDSAFGVAHLVGRAQTDAVLLDIGLPYRPGTELLEELKSDPRTASVPVIVVSGMAESLSDERRALAAAVLTKPVHPDELVGTVAACVARSQQSAAT